MEPTRSKRPERESNFAMQSKSDLQRKIRNLTLFFIVALVVSGATAIPIESELTWLSQFLDGSSEISRWVLEVTRAMKDTNAHFPYLAYGTDWLAFGHFVVAVSFVGPLRNPVRNVWVYEFGLIACLMVIPYAFVFGEIRAIPVYWRLIDCSFGLFGLIPLWYCRKWSLQLCETDA